MNYLETSLNALNANIRYYTKAGTTTLSNGILKGKELVSNRFSKEMEAVASGCKAASAKTYAFVLNNDHPLFFAASSCATAYFAPHLFLPSAIGTVIIRLECRKLIDTYIKDEHNPYVGNSKFGPNYIKSTELVLALASAIDAVALGTVFYTHSWVISLMPILGGIAAGNVASKIGMDLFYPASQPSQAMAA